MGEHTNTNETEVLEIIKNFTPPNEGKFSRYEARMHRMIGFYKEKAQMEGVPENQAKMFTGFVHSLEYFLELARHHRKLTNKVAGKEITELEPVNEP